MTHAYANGESRRRLFAAFVSSSRVHRISRVCTCTGVEYRCLQACACGRARARVYTGAHRLMMSQILPVRSLRGMLNTRASILQSLCLNESLCLNDSGPLKHRAMTRGTICSSLFVPCNPLPTHMECPWTRVMIKRYARSRRLTREPILHYLALRESASCSLFSSHLVILEHFRKVVVGLFTNPPPA